MSAFLWTFIALCAFGCLAKVLHLTANHGARYVPRWADGFDLLINIGFIVWAVTLL